jgi:cytochrome c biogenesis protein CcdA
MTDLWFGISTAIWLGLVTAVSPCPLATNLAAVTYIGRHVNQPRRVVWSGVAYGLGRILAYTVLGVLITSALMTATAVSSALQDVMAKVIGPILILAGMILLDLLPITMTQGVPFANKLSRLQSSPAFGAVSLGFLCALAFCPVSAALFFGSLVPLSIQHGHSVLYPVLYGAATAFPVVILGIALALGALWAGNLLKLLPRIEQIMRRLTGIVFIIAGLYLVAKYVFGLI